MYAHFYAFGRVYNHIKPASQVPVGCDYMLFKVNIYIYMYLLEFSCTYTCLCMYHIHKQLHYSSPVYQAYIVAFPCLYMYMHVHVHVHVYT